MSSKTLSCASGQSCDTVDAVVETLFCKAVDGFFTVNDIAIAVCSRLALNRKEQQS